LDVEDEELDDDGGFVRRSKELEEADPEESESEFC